MDSMGTPEEANVQGSENVLEKHSEQMKGMTPEQKKFVQGLLKENLIRNTRIFYNTLQQILHLLENYANKTKQHGTCEINALQQR